MADSIKFHLLSLGSAPRNNTMSWISDELLIYAGLNDVCISRMIDGQLMPETIFSILSNATFRSMRLIKAANAKEHEFETIATTTDGRLLILRFVRNQNAKWIYETVLERKRLKLFLPQKMVDAFGFRSPLNELIICFATFVRVEFQFLDSSLQVRKRHFNAMADNYFIMVNCLDVMAADSNYQKFLCIYGLTNKKLAIHLFDESGNLEEEFKPSLIDSREAIWNLHIRKDDSLPDDPFSFEVLAGTEERVQIWKLQTAKQADEREKTVTAFALESKQHLKFSTVVDLIARLDSNVWITTSERLSSVRWDNQRQNFIISTRENAIKVYSLDNTKSESGIWSLKREICSYGEPALELAGIFDVFMSPSSKWLLAHNTIGGFYLFSCNEELEFTPISVFIGGHGGKVRDLTWHENGDVLLTVGSDKTTRYFKPYSNGHWGQRSRPQVHGHPIRCISSLEGGFLTGSTEHMFRVFGSDLPKIISTKAALERIQPLNLTPKQQSYDAMGGDISAVSTNDIDLNLPLNEELLQSGTSVHEEKRKLYAHGNECYTVATTPNQKLAFTAAKGSRPVEAQLIVWQTSSWKLLQRVTDHTLTITAVSASEDGRYLLTVSRDRGFCIYEIDYESQTPLQLRINQKQAHKRVIWCCAWLPGSPHIFAIGSRDGLISLFQLSANGNSVVELQKWQFGECVSSLVFGQRLSSGQAVIVVGTETGNICVAKVGEDNRVQVDTAQKVVTQRWFRVHFTSLCVKIQLGAQIVCCMYRKRRIEDIFSLISIVMQL
ncbi:putative Stat3-interacting protein [Aphelenchoides bicaudatus]|nr:putative Stat3-interacting protein [Aphelenchoides bicaudatus]